MTKEQLIKKVYRCIDEVYPGTDSESPDVEEFNIPAFLDEAIRWVVKAVPVTALGEGTSLLSKFGRVSNLVLPKEFLRLLEFKMNGWGVSVTEALPQSHPRYWQQQNAALRGGNSRPVVFLVKGETALEPYPYYDKASPILGSTDRWPDVTIFRYFAMPSTDTDYEKYPDKLLDITAWKTAELIFSVMQDANGVAIAQSNITSILPTL